MNPEQLAALKSFLRALGTPPERESAIMRAGREDAPPPRDELITTRAAAEILAVHPQTVFRYRKGGRLHSVKRSPRVTRWHKSEVEALANGGDHD